MGTQDRQRTLDLRIVADDYAALLQGPPLRAPVLGHKFGRAKNNERSSSPLSVLFCRTRSRKAARRACDYRSGRQEVFARNARCNSRAVANRGDSGPRLGRGLVITSFSPSNARPRLAQGTEIPARRAVQRKTARPLFQTPFLRF